MRAVKAVAAHAFIEALPQGHQSVGTYYRSQAGKECVVYT